MEKYAITITVLGRQFPARVDSEEAAVIQEAAQSINAKMKAFKAEYKNQDDLNIAIMCCLDIMTEYLAHKTQTNGQVQTVLNELSNLEEKLSQSLALAEEM
ncbi:MAG: cell division protein ZapA [Bacteroidota bacterium]